MPGAGPCSVERKVKMARFRLLDARTGESPFDPMEACFQVTSKRTFCQLSENRYSVELLRGPW